MTPETRDIFVARHQRDMPEIAKEADKLAAMYGERIDDWLPWYVAAERALTAQRIERQRLSLSTRCRLVESQRDRAEAKLEQIAEIAGT